MKHERGPHLSVECLMTRKRGALPRYSFHHGDFDSRVSINLSTISKGGCDYLPFSDGKTESERCPETVHNEELSSC